MLKRIQEYGKFVLIAGFKDVKITDVNYFIENLRASAEPASTQVFDADRVAGPEHLFFAALNALKSFDQGNNISKTIDMESLLYASGQRQIEKAIDMLGVRSGTSDVALLILGDDKSEVQGAEKRVEEFIDGVRDDKVLDVRSREKVRRLMGLFNITDLELKSLSEGGGADYKTITNLIIERVALLAVRR